MQVGVIGISYRSSDLTLREEMAKACVETSSIDHLFSHVLLTTCNRIEIYFSTEDLAETHSTLLAWLRSKLSTPFEHKLYSYFGIECFAHIAKVTSGLDSVIVAETEIQGQVKRAYRDATLCQNLPSCLHYLFQKALRIAKQTRSYLPTPNSLEKLLFQLSSSLFENMCTLPILFIGNSQINRKILHYFKQRGAQNSFICTHKPSSPECLPWDALSSWTTYPLVICGTHQNQYILHPEMIQGCATTRLIFDLSMPRTVNPKLAQHPQILLMNLEDLRPHLSSQETIQARTKSQLRMSVERYYSLFQEKTYNRPLAECALLETMDSF